MTRQRALILEIVQKQNGHMSAEEIFLAAKKVLPGMAMGTVYNNLNALCERGNVRRLTMPQGADRFDVCSPPHDHLLCESCGKLSDITLPELSKQLETCLPVEVLSYDLVVRCRCERCAMVEEALGN